MSTTEPSILSAEEILQKKEDLKQEDAPKTNGDLNGHSLAMETEELSEEIEISDKNGTVLNGTSNGKTVNGETQNGDTKKGVTENGDIKTDEKSSSEISKQVDANIELAQNSVQEMINLKRKRIQEVAEKLANEEARYTVLKKIRLSQLSTENAAKEAQDAVEASNPNKMEDKKLNPSEIHNISSASSAKDNKFKPIQPAIKTLSGKNSPAVLSPTPKLHRASPGFDSPKTKNGKKLNSKDLDDVHQLAHFLANNQKMSENDVKAAKTLVFRKQLNKTLQQCDPPQPEQPDIIFFPSNNSVDFVNLVGLEQVVTHIKAMNAKKKPDSPEKKPKNSVELANADCWTVAPRKTPPKPVECSNCGTDFSPQWHKGESENDSSKFYCITCVSTHCKDNQRAGYDKSMQASFKIAAKHEKEMKEELDREYTKKLAQVKEDQRRREMANKQIRELQKQKLQSQQLQQQQQALKQQRELQKVMEQKKQERQKKQQQMQQSSNSSDSASTNAVLRQLINQLTNTQNQHSKADIQRVMALVQSQLVQSGMNKQQEIMQMLQQHIISQQQQQQQGEQQKRQQQQKQQQQQQLEAERKRQAELQRQRELEARKRREQQETERRRRAAAEEAERKKHEQTVAIQQLLMLIQQTNNPEDQQKLLQVLLQQAGNNREVQARLVEQVVKMAQNQQKKR